MAAGGGRGALGGTDYYSLDAVLAEETLIPCMFKCGSRCVGRALDPSSGAEDVAPRAAVELPLWMLQPLTSRDMLAVKCVPPALLDVSLTVYLIECAALQPGIREGAPAQLQPTQIMLQ